MHHQTIDKAHFRQRIQIVGLPQIIQQCLLPRSSMESEDRGACILSGEGKNEGYRANYERQGKADIIFQLIMKWPSQKGAVGGDGPYIYFTDSNFIQLLLRREMNPFAFGIDQTMQNPLSQYLFVHPNYFPQNIPLYPYTPAFQLDFGKGTLPFPNLNSSFSQNSSGSAEETLKSELPPTISMPVLKKQKKVVTQEEQEGEQFLVKEVKTSSGSSFSYKKKNTESNIVNQTFSFLSSEKSKSVARTYFKGNQQKVEEYYRVLVKVRQNSKKYINRVYLKRLLAFEKKTEFERAFLKAKTTILSIDEIRTALRVLLFQFLKEQVTINMLTSCKIYKETLPEHFWRKRQIMGFLFEKAGPELQ